MENIVRVWIGDPYDGGHFNGTAFFIDEHTLLTAKHVIVNSKGDRYENIFLSNTPDGGISPVIDVRLCERDIAILKVKKTFKINKKKIIFTDELSVGTNVNVVGFYDKNSSQKNYENRVSGYQNNEHTYELQNHLTHGLSGSPVFLDGKIAGLTKAINSSKNLTYVIPIDEICQDIKLEASEEDIQINKEVVNEFYSIRVPFVIFLGLIIILQKLIFSHGYQLEDAIMADIVFAYFLSKIALYMIKKIKRRGDD